MNYYDNMWLSDLKVRRKETGAFKLDATYSYENNKEKGVWILRDIDISNILPACYAPSVDISTNEYNSDTYLKALDDRFPIGESHHIVKETKVKEMTIEDIEKALGYKIKIVGD